MAEKENVAQMYPGTVKLKDFGGEVVCEICLKDPLPFPYLFWNQRLFVTSRDDARILLERRYHLFIGEEDVNEKHK